MTCPRQSLSLWSRSVAAVGVLLLGACASLPSLPTPTLSSGAAAALTAAEPVAAAPTVQAAPEAPPAPATVSAPARPTANARPSTPPPVANRTPRPAAPVAAAPPAATAATTATDPKRAAALRASGLEQLNRGNVTSAVSLLRQASTLDPASPLIKGDLDRALRVSQAVAGKAPAKTVP